MDGIRLLLFAAAPRYRNYGKSSGGIVVECDFKSRFDRGTKAPSARVQALSLSLSFFLRAPSAEHVIVSRRRGGGGAEGRKGGKKEGRGTPRVPGGQWALPSLPPSLCPLPAIAVRTIELFFRADFRRSSAGARARGDRLSVVGSARKLPATGFNLQVGLFRASETRDGHRERAAACSLTGNSQFPANSAISCRVCPLCNPACGDAIFRPPFSQQRHRARAGRPSCCGVERDRDRERERERVRPHGLPECNLIAVTNSMSAAAAALFSSSNPLGTRVDCDEISTNHDTSSTTRGND